MTAGERQAEIATLPLLSVADGRERETRLSATPISIVSRQGRLLLRLVASVEAMEGRTRELAQIVQTQQEERLQLGERLQESQRTVRQTEWEAEEHFRACAEEAIFLMDLLERATEVLDKQDHALAKELRLARKEGVRRFAALGITEIPTVGEMDGRLHEGVDTVPSSSIPPYHIVSVVRSGWQRGARVLRRATVITAVPDESAPLTTPASVTAAETTEQTHECDIRGKERESAGQSGTRKRRPRVSTRSDHRD